MGDSIVRDYPEYPWYFTVPIQGWGHLIPRYFRPELQWRNDARGHQSTTSFIAEGRVANALAAQPRFLLIMFGIVDADADPYYYAAPDTLYRQNLHRMVTDARAAGAEPIFVTPTPIRRAAEDGWHVARPNGLEPWADAMIAQGAEDGVPVADLQYWLLDEYDRIGVPTAQKLYGLEQDGAQDTVHFSPYGADQAARHIAAQIPQLAPNLAGYLLQSVAPVFPPWAKPAFVALLGLAALAAGRARAR